jgi:hypothetical protein
MDLGRGPWTTLRVVAKETTELVDNERRCREVLEQQQESLEAPATDGWLTGIRDSSTSVQLDPQAAFLSCFVFDVAPNFRLSFPGSCFQPLLCSGLSF